VNHPVVHVLALDKAAARSRADHSDGQLLDLFFKRRDEDAFAAVVRRHGPMVLAVCRRVLRNPADADDAFQAAFLVLARRAGSLTGRGLLAPWLHGVAFNTARRLRRDNGRRANRERPLADVPEPMAAESLAVSDELLAVLDEELARLPDRYRATLVICDLEGLTRKEAARQLRCPEGTVAGRLARARALLAARLANRGIAPSASLLALLLTQQPTSALMVAHVNGAIGAVFGGAVFARVATTVERVVAAMLLRKLTSTALVLVACGIVAALAGIFRAEVSAGIDPAAPPDTQSVRAEPAAPKAARARVLTEFPLRKLDAEKTAEQLRKLYPGDAIITPVPDDKVLLLYADAKTTGDIEDALVKFGEAPRKKPTRIPLRFTVAADIATSLTEIFVGPPGGRRGPARVTIVPVADENALLVYATDADTATIRKLLTDHIDAAPAPGKQVSPKPALAPEKKHTVRFENAPWKEVLAWYAEISGLQMVAEAIPAGSLTMKPPKDREFTVGEITDLLNESLTSQKYILVRRKASFILQPSDEKIDPSWVPLIELNDLSTRGRTELVQALIPLKTLSAEDTAREIRRLLSPFGSVSILARSNTLLILDTAANVKRICDTLRNVDIGNDEFFTHVCKYKKAQEVADHLNSLLADRANFVRAVAERSSNSVVVIGPPDKIAMARKIIAEFDKGAKPLVVSDPELRKYSVPAGTADAIVKTLLADKPSLRIVAVPVANEIWVMATPEEHQELSKRLSGPNPKRTAGPVTETIPLTHLDPKETVDLLHQLFRSWNLKCEIDTSAKNSIQVTATAEQIKQIREIIEAVDREPTKPRSRP